MNTAWTEKDWETAPVMLTARDVQRISKLSWPTTLKMIHSENFPVLVIGRALRIPTVAFRRYLETAGQCE